MKVFISYSRNDFNIAKKIANDIRLENIDVWFDYDQISAGDSVAQKIQDGLINSNYVAVVLTKNSVTSGWVQTEWQSILHDEVQNGIKKIIPLLVEDCVLPPFLKDRHYADFRYDYSIGIKELLKAIKIHRTKVSDQSTLSQNGATILEYSRGFEALLKVKEPERQLKILDDELSNSLDERRKLSEFLCWATSSDWDNKIQSETGLIEKKIADYERKIKEIKEKISSTNKRINIEEKKEKDKLNNKRITAIEEKIKKYNLDKKFLLGLQSHLKMEHSIDKQIDELDKDNNIKKIRIKNPQNNQENGIKYLEKKISIVSEKIADLESRKSTIYEYVRRIKEFEVLIRKTIDEKDSDVVSDKHEWRHRAKLIKELNIIALENTGTLFNDLCRSVPPNRFPYRIVHSLAPASSFQHRPELDLLTDWWVDEQQKYILSLVGLGGAGKTALLERFISFATNATYSDAKIKTYLPEPEMLFVWSFYEEPSSEGFLLALYSYLSSIENEIPPIPSWKELYHKISELLEKHRQLRLLIVMDGLERIQEDRSDCILGELQSKPLKQLLRRMASGLGNARSIITTRYPIPDLQDWENIGYHSFNLDKLPISCAINLLRSHHVLGGDQILKKIVFEFGLHALTLDHLGKILFDFFDGNPRCVDELPPLGSNVTGEKQGQRLARLFSFYEKKLPETELNTLMILSSFRFPVGIETLIEVLVRKEGKKKLGEMNLLNLSDLRLCLVSLKKRNLIYIEDSDKSSRFGTHPAIREYFYQKLTNRQTVHSQVAIILTKRVSIPSIVKNIQSLDLFEELLYHSVHSGDTKNAFSIFLTELGGYKEIGERLGAFQRGEDILSHFVPHGQTPPGTPSGLTDEQLKEYYFQRSLFAAELGNLKLAVSALKAHIRRRQSILDDLKPSYPYIQLVNYQILLGRLNAAKELTTQLDVELKKTLLVKKIDIEEEIKSYKDFGSYDSYLRGKELFDGLNKEYLEAKKSLQSIQSVIAALLGDKVPVMNDVSSVNEWWSLHGCLWYVSLILRNNPVVAATQILELEKDIMGLSWNNHSARWRIQLALAFMLKKMYSKGESTLKECLSWANRSSNQEASVNAHLALSKLYMMKFMFIESDYERKNAWRIAEECGFRLHLIDLLNIEAELNIYLKNPKNALLASSKAFELASDESCSFIWGVADALKIKAESLYLLGKQEESERVVSNCIEIYKHLGCAKNINFGPKFPNFGLLDE